jgi:DDE domain
VFIRINGTIHYLWRAVDQHGDVLDILVQSRRNANAARKFFRRLLTGLRYVVGAGYSVTPLIWGDAYQVQFGMIDVCDVAARVPDLLSAQRLVRAPPALGGVQGRGDPGAAPPGERLASAGRPSASVLGGPCGVPEVGPRR